MNKHNLGDGKMNGYKFAMALFFVFAFAANAMARNAPNEVVSLAKNTLVLYGADPLIVAVVRGQNAKGKTLAEIKKLDKFWKNTQGISDHMRRIMKSECANYLRRIKISKAYFAEIFLMDHHGALIATTDKTSDFWQGDEDKFQKSYNHGSGAVFVGNVAYDKSTRTDLVHISVPVMDGGKAIGAITFGIDVSKVK